MKKCLSRWVSFFVFIVLFVTLTSCKPDQNNLVTTSRPEVNEVTELIPYTGIQVTETPQPVSSSSELSIIEPAAGSIMRWIDYSDFVFIPAGTFQMGEDSVLLMDFSPKHEVSLNGFWLQQAEVTNQQYAKCVADGQCTVPSIETDEPYRYEMPEYVNLPVVGVTWDQATEYCTYINGRLPSEAEWEYAARGVESDPYPWGKDEPSCDFLNYDNCLDPSEPADVRSYDAGASSFEVMDTAGNVYEWVNDWYQEDYYAGSPSVNPQGPEEGTEKIYRGGSYLSTKNLVSPILRFSLNPKEHSKEIGFRCVLLKSGELDSSVSYYPPACEVPAYLDTGVIVSETMTPFPACSPAEISTYCKWSGSMPITGIIVSLADCYNDNYLDNNIWGNDIKLNCTSSGVNPKVYSCDPPQGAAQGSAIIVKYCHSLPPNHPEHLCPIGYLYDYATGFCLPISDWMQEPPCPSYYYEMDGMCLPKLINEDLDCPLGFFTINVNNEWVCYPSNECYFPDPPESCKEPVCAEGQSYDLEHDCCRSPEDYKICPIGEAYNAVEKYCYVPERWPENCFTNTIILDYCSTPTPTATTPPIVCSSYNSQAECEANNCKWENYAGVIGGHCVK